MKNLLRTNAKLHKSFGKASQYLITGLTLAPARLSGHEVCEARSPGCTGGCLAWFSGMRVFENVRERAIAQTQWLFSDREAFVAELHKNIAQHVRNAELSGLTPLIRLNVASDLEWYDIIQAWPGVQFYDYTAVRSRFDEYLSGKLPANYALTFSAKEWTDDWQIRSYLERGANVAMVFDVAYFPQIGRIDPLPKTRTIDRKRFQIVDGDLHDVRLPAVDGRGKIIGLRLKGTTKSKAHSVNREFAR